MDWSVAKYHQSPFEMARRCGYCGKFCHESRIHNPSGLCNDCRVELGEASDKGEGDKHMEVEATEDPGERRLSSDAPGLPEHAENVDNTEGTEATAEDQGGLFKEKETHEKEPIESSGKKSSEGSAEQWCGRCWTRPPTQILYGCPVCDSCVDEAEKEKAGKTGNQRFQPRNPTLPPGKRLTRVCDECRAKRKRCPHRQIVDADDPAVAGRGKKAAMAAAAADNASGSESGDDQSSDMEVDPPVGSVPEEGHSAEDNLRSSIRDAVRIVYSREHQQLLARAAERADQAEAAMDAFVESMAAVQTHLEGWAARGDDHAMTKDEEEKVAAASEAMNAAEEAVETSKQLMAAWLGKYPRSN